MKNEFSVLGADNHQAVMKSNHINRPISLIAVVSVLLSGLALSSSAAAQPAAAPKKPGDKVLRSARGLKAKLKAKQADKQPGGKQADAKKKDAKATTPAAAPVPGRLNKAPLANEPPAELPGTAEDPPTTTDELHTKLSTPYRPKPGGHRVKFNLEDADLAELVNHISGLTGKRFIYGAKVRQIKVTVVSPTPVTLNEAYEAFLSILDANGMTVVPHGRFLKIVDSGGVVSKGTPIYSRGAPVPDTDRVITRLYRLKYASPTEVTKVLTKFKSKEGDLSVYDPGGLLIMTDSGSNIRRMIRIVEELDVGGSSTKMWIEPVYYGSAEDLAKQLNDIYELNKKEGGDTGGLSRVIAEEQTNSLIVVGTEESYTRLLELLRRVDTAPAAEGRIHVLPLQHADAEELSQTMTRMLGGTSGSSSTKNKKGQAGAVAEMFEGDVRLTADVATNSLIVSSSARDFAQLRLVINELDQKRRQVFLEAVIMDVSVDRTSELGLAYHGGITAGAGDDTVVLGGFNAANSIVPTPDQLQALALGVRGPELDGTQNLPGLPGVSVPAFGVFLNALATSGDSNVLSTPHIIATDNTEAEINIGENVPLQTNIAGGFGGGNLASLAGQAGGQAAGLGNALGALGGGFNFNAQRTDVGTKIKITPHINDEHQVRLEIEEEISETGAASGALGAVSITQRTAKTTVVVDDQQTVVIGGLMRDTKSTEEQKVPILGDLPVLGFLFRNSTERMRKTNLLLILTPHVIRDQQDLRRVFQRKMQERQQFLDRYFVFTSDWEPPRDFSRTNGLVEDVRQAFFRLEEMERIRRESQPRELKIHEPSIPMELAGSVKSEKVTTTAAPKRATPRRATPKKKVTPKKRTPAKARPKGSDAAPIRINPVARNIDSAGETPGIVDRVE